MILKVCLVGIGSIGLTTLAAAAPYVPDPDISPQMKALFALPSTVKHDVIAMAPENPNTAGVVRCTYYPGFMIKEVDTGQQGDDAIYLSLQSASSGAPSCEEKLGTGEIALQGTQGDYLLGAKANFVFLMSTNDGDTTGFEIIDGRRGETLYSDNYYGAGLQDISVSNNTLTITYRRGAETNCSIAEDGGLCWARLVKNGALPKAIAAQAPPIDLCKEGYASASQKEENSAASSIISYNVVMTLDENGHHRVLSRGAMSCDPGS